MKQTLRFFDPKKRNTFKTTKYDLKTRQTKGGKRYFAVAKAPSGSEAWRIISNELYKKQKKK